MLVLSRKAGEQLHIGDAIKVTVVEINGNRIKLGIEAPESVRIFRKELDAFLGQVGCSRDEEAVRLGASA